MQLCTYLFGDPISGFDMFCDFIDDTMFRIYLVSFYLTWCSDRFCQTKVCFCLRCRGDNDPTGLCINLGDGQLSKRGPICLAKQVQGELVVPFWLSFASAVCGQKVDRIGYVCQSGFATHHWSRG